MSETEVVRRRDTTFSSHVFYCSITEKISRYGRMSSISNRHFFYCSALFNRQKKRRLYYVGLVTNISDAGIYYLYFQ
ncbi:uncharacterized protein isoform X3 [Bombus fervidus]|uniref:uncharacterized protein isoform X3 n=1 Tax=Bombus fervidus TaxID=203811 RepID=UPI003D18AC1E